MKKICNNCTEWRNDEGRRHRLDGPAIEWTDGDKEWWLNGRLHRLKGPAIEYNDAIKWTDGYREWWLNGKRHRLDGPAIERFNGYKEWWINGSQHSEEEWFNLLTEDEKLNYILKGEK